MDAAEQAALRLSVDERLRLIERLWNSIVDTEEQNLTLSVEVREVLERRLDAHRRDPDAALSWDEIQRRARG